MMILVKNLTFLMFLFETFNVTFLRAHKTSSNPRYKYHIKDIGL